MVAVAIIRIVNPRPNLAAVDLNLLVAFQALLEERHVTRAGRRVGMSQSGMSNALARLRELTGDALFVRGKQGMVPTSVALELGPPVRQALEIVERALTRDDFDPAASTRTYVVAMPDGIEGLFLGHLLRLIEPLAPSVRVAAVPLSTSRPDRDLLRSGADLAIGAIGEGAWRRERLYHESFSVVLDAQRAPARMTLARYCRSPHVVWSPVGDLRGHLDQRLEALGRARVVVASTSSFLALPHLVRGSDRIATVPTRIATMLAEDHGLALLRVPFDLEGFDIHMAWHSVWDDDAGSGWLRDMVRQVAAGHGH